MKSLFKLFFPVPYPQAAIWHIILGGIVAGLIGYLFWEYRGYGYRIPVTGALIGVVVGALVFWSYTKKP